MTAKDKTPMSLYSKLLEVRKSVPYLQKDAQSNQFKYNASSQVLGAVRQKLDDLGVLLITSVLHRQVNSREKPNKSGGTSVTYEVDLDVEYKWVNVENPEETIVIPWFTMGLDTGDNSKAVGKALTYSEKYFMLKQFNIATDHDDPDTFQNKAENNVKEVPEQEDILLLSDKISEFARLRNQTVDAVHKALNIKELDKLTFPQINAHHLTLDKWITGAKEKAAKEKAEKAESKLKAEKEKETVGA